jgi:hypothetical protein
MGPLNTGFKVLSTVCWERCHQLQAMNLAAIACTPIITCFHMMYHSPLKYGTQTRETGD